jgi:hypothetical protein
MMSESPIQVRVPRCTVVKIQQQDNSSNSSIVSKPRLTTGYMCSMSGSQDIYRSSSPPFPPPPPLPPNRSPEPSPSSILTQPKRVINSSAVVNSNRTENKSFALYGRQTQQFSSSKRSVKDSQGSQNAEKTNDRRNETFLKREKDCKEKSKNKDSDGICSHKKSRCIFSSQISLIFHVSITFCLIGYKGIVFFVVQNLYAFHLMLN